MTVHSYKTHSGRNVIREYLDSIPDCEAIDGLSVIKKMEDNKLNELSIKKWKDKVYEVYFYRHNRLFYVTFEDTDVYLLHACRKQKNKTEKKDANIVIKRAKELGRQLSKEFIR